MQAAIASRCLRIMNHSIPARCFNRHPQTVLNPLRVGLQFSRSAFFIGARSLSRKPGLWSSARTTPSALRINAFQSDISSRSPQNPGPQPNGYNLFSTEAKQQSKQLQTTVVKSVRTSEEHIPNTKIIATLAKYLWMKDNFEFQFRVIAALGLLIGAKVVNVQAPFLFKVAVGWLSAATGNAGSLAEFTAANSTMLAVFAGPTAILIGYGIARSGAAAFNELRTAICSKVALRTIRLVSRKVYVASPQAPIQDATMSFSVRCSSISVGRGLKTLTKTNLQLKQYHSSSDSEQHNPTFAPVAKPSLPPFQHSLEADSLSQVLIQHHNPFHHMESSIQLNGISLSPPLIHQTLLRLHHHSKIALAFFKYSQSHHPSTSPPLLDTAAYNIIIDIFCKVRQFDVAWQMILQMDNRENHSKPDFTTFFVLIRRLVSSGLTRTAIRAFYDIGIFLGNENFESQFSFYFCHLLDTLCKYGFVKVAVEVFNKEKYRVDVNAKMYTVLIYGWCKVGKTEMGKKFLGEMLERGIEPHVVTYNVLLNGICRHASLHPEGRFERVIGEAEKVFDQMHDRGLEPDVTTYSILLHVYSRGHKPQLCLDKLEIMKENGIWPNLATYTSVIKCLCSCGRMEDAEELLNEMVRYGVSPTAETYNCFFKEYRGRKDVEGAMKLYMRMKEDNTLLSPDMHTYNILLGMFMKLSKMSLAWEIWNDINESGVGPDLDAYTMLVHGLCEKGKWKKACDFFMQMIEKGFLPQKVTFETLYRGLIQADMLRTWRRLKKKLEEESITFGSEFKEYQLKPYKR